MNDILESLVADGIVSHEHKMIYLAFRSKQMVSYLEDIRQTMFMTPPRSLTAEELAWRDGRQDFVRTIFEVIESVSYKIKTEGKECQSYLTPTQQAL